MKKKQFDPIFELQEEAFLNNDTSVTYANAWNYTPGYELPQNFQCGGVDNAGKYLKVDTDGYIRLFPGGGGGTTYAGTNGIKVDNVNYTIGVDTAASTPIQVPSMVVNGELATASGAQVDFTGAEVDLSNNATCGTPTTNVSIVNKQYADTKQSKVKYSEDEPSETVDGDIWLY